MAGIDAAPGGLADWERSERNARGDKTDPKIPAKDKPAVADAVSRMREAG